MKRLRRFLVLVITVPALIAGVAALLLYRGRASYATAFEVRPGLGQVMMTGAHVYVYAMPAGDKILLFDAGTDPKGKAIDALLGTFSRARADVEDVFLTHGHGDHVAAAGLFLQARVYAGADDVDLIARRVSPDRILAQLFFYLAPVPAVDVTDPLNGAAEIPVAGGKSVKAIPVPGHTMGSFAYLFDGVLFVGDTLSLDHGKLGVGPHVFTSDVRSESESIQKLKQVLSKETVDIVCTGHGGCTRSGEGHDALDRATASEGNWAPLF